MAKLFMDTSLKLLCVTFIVTTLVLKSFSAPVKRQVDIQNAAIKDQVKLGLDVMDIAITKVLQAVSAKVSLVYCQ